MVNKKQDLVSAKLTPAFIQSEYVEKQRSFEDIAKELGSNSNRVRRYAKKIGAKIRNHSEAQAAALSTGKVQHPTAGKKLSHETKEKISRTVEKSWAGISEEERERRRAVQSENFSKRDDLDEMRVKAARAVRNARDVGSKAEQAMIVYLRDKGLKVEFHRKNLIPNQKLEADIYLPELKVIIEMDGIGHRENVFGRLHKQKFADSVKNGLLTTRDFIVIRIQDTAKTNSKAYNRRMWEKLEAIIDRIDDIERPSVLTVKDN